jgi:hypothetical protein
MIKPSRLHMQAPRIRLAIYFPWLLRLRVGQASLESATNQAFIDIFSIRHCICANLLAGKITNEPTFFKRIRDNYIYAGKLPKHHNGRSKTGPNPQVIHNVDKKVTYPSRALA